MAKSIKLPLTNEERTLLRKAKIKINEVHTTETDQLATILNAPHSRAKTLKGIAEFQTVPSIGHKLAEKLVYTLHIYSLEEIKNKHGAELFDQYETQVGVWADSCVEDQLRCVIYYANNPTSTKQWFDFTDERKAYRALHGFPENRPTKAWYE
ncbi:helix-hairpin-helix domain-containing protein [Radiobacillus deserti]|uniref:Pathogenicity locus n=1 Tax=Radiobacillus deserti TaxID=2594883 RepID=A0A516KKM3_9BACI|nr:helix-hairpin-helix domain-containing protein [Radiobacillus deserti]QDP41944.1 Pathogenicity locus [Radiobacillus deserti]